MSMKRNLKIAVRDVTTNWQISHWQFRYAGFFVLGTCSAKKGLRRYKKDYADKYSGGWHTLSIAVLHRQAD